MHFFEKKPLVILAMVLVARVLLSQQIDWPHFLAQQDLVWEEIDTDFYNGAFIGDGIQGAMIMQDESNTNGIRMLMGHYQAIAHYSISGWEYCDSRVYAGNIFIHPEGTAVSQTMRLNVWDGEASGVITTDKGRLSWRAFAERQHNVFVVVLDSDGDEKESTLGIRPEWGITPRIYLENKSPNDYIAHLPPRPTTSRLDSVDLVRQKMKTRGAHVVASRVVKKGNSQILYVAIGVDDSRDTNVAAQKATEDGLSRIKAAMAEDLTALTQRHQHWWHSYMQSSYVHINEDSYWEKFWWLQLYKFGSASSGTSAFVMDTQGPWIWQTAWAAVWWNLNAQLSYFPMFSGNKLEAGRSFINGMDRIYKSGAFHDNAGGTGIFVGRSSTYEGRGSWGDELGNMPWLLHTYWKYWQYSGDENIGRALFPMLKENMRYLSTKLVKQADGHYHLKESRSPEYSDNVLLPDANYGLMSIDWVLRTLLDMDDYFNFNDPERDAWQEKLDNLLPFPADVFGFRVSANQGFDKGHRHYSHLLAIYPYHTVNPDTGQRDIVQKSINRWLSLTEKSGHAGYTFTGGCAMQATLGNGNEALRLLDLLKGKLQPNTMYSEGGGPVIETPLSGVESINYMLLQSWGGVIRIFPALPSRWRNVSFANLRTEGAFLVSASVQNGHIGTVSITSEKGKTCTVKNPWAGKTLYIKDANGDTVSATQNGDTYSFPTTAGVTYTLSDTEHTEIKTGFLLEQNYPNPFKSTTTISYKLEAPAFVTLKLFNIRGQEVATLVNEQKSAERHTVRVDTTRLASGIYFYQLRVGNSKVQRKMSVLG